MYFHPNRSSFIPVNLIHLPLARPMVLCACLIYHRPQKMMPFHGPLMQNRPWWVLGSYCYTLLQAKIMDFTIWKYLLTKILFEYWLNSNFFSHRTKNIFNVFYYNRFYLKRSFHLIPVLKHNITKYFQQQKCYELYWGINLMSMLKQLRILEKVTEF